MGVDAGEPGSGGFLMGSTSKKPIMRIIRNLARSGGTLFGKCLGCMDKVTLISEIHPSDLKTTNPMMQAQQWFGLITAKDIAQWKMRPPSVLQFVSMCQMRASARSELLVLRDWSHLDYIGVPFARPGYGFALGDALNPMYDLRIVTTVRHPIDQYLSLMGLPAVMQGLRIEQYCLGCLRMSEYASEHGFYRYEDFTKDPDAVLSSICSDLELPFDEGYREKWSTYTTITGDTTPTLGRGSTKKTIESFERKPIDDELLEAFRKNEDYQRACALLGYEA